MPSPAESQLGTPLNQVSGIGTARAAALAELGIRNVGQLVAHLPSRHERQEAEASIDQLAADSVVSARGTVTATRIVNRGSRPRFEAVLADDTGRLDLVWFNGLFMRHTIQPGVRLLVQGKAKRFGQGGLQLVNPKSQVLDPSATGGEPAKRDEHLRPVYPASENVTSPQIEGAIRLVLPTALGQIIDHFPETFRQPRELPELSLAYRMMHEPEDEPQAAAGRRRLAYDELFMLQLGLAIKRSERRDHSKGIPLRWSEAIDRHIRARFAFTLTPDQDSVVNELVADLTQPTPANRLIQGDVGSGKTAVALYAMLLSVASEHQAALMVPTELLAEQHFRSITAMLVGSSVRIELLTGGLPAAQRRGILARLADGSIDIVVGTHALLTEGVAFKSLAVAIIDEQHRFGVHQRATLREVRSADEAGEGSGLSHPKRGAGSPLDAAPPKPTTIPHMLVMTATPIPRTLAMTLFGDLDVSTIRRLPPGRKPIATRVLAPDKTDEVYAFVRKRIDAGEQAYVVVPTIEGDGDLFTAAEAGDVPAAPRAAAPTTVGAGVPLKSIREVRARLETGALSGARLAEVHGRMPASERDAVMRRFRAGEIDVLIATTVIEVGVDVPNATVMVVESAERFGLAQLHQLRGRVGRGGKSSVCVLIGSPVTPEAEERLKVMAKVKDGFALAERDLEIRGFGDVMGVRQAGIPPFKVADLTKDLDLLAMARRDAAEWIARSPRLAAPADGLLRRRLLKAHGQWLGLADVG